MRTGKRGVEKRRAKRVAREFEGGRDHRKSKTRKGKEKRKSCEEK